MCLTFQIYGRIFLWLPKIYKEMPTHKSSWEGVWTRPCLDHCYHFWIRNKLRADFLKWKGNTKAAPQRDFVTKGLINRWISGVLSLDEAQLPLPLTAFDTQILYFQPPVSPLSLPACAQEPDFHIRSGIFWVKRIKRKIKKKEGLRVMTVKKGRVWWAGWRLVYIFGQCYFFALRGLNTNMHHTKYKNMCLILDVL